jgi:hypothetical protein
MLSAGAEQRLGRLESMLETKGLRGDRPGCPLDVELLDGIATMKALSLEGEGGVHRAAGAAADDLAARRRTWVLLHSFLESAATMQAGQRLEVRQVEDLAELLETRPDIAERAASLLETTSMEYTDCLSFHLKKEAHPVFGRYAPKLEVAQPALQRLVGEIEQRLAGARAG